MDDFIDGSLLPAMFLKHLLMFRCSLWMIRGMNQSLPCANNWSITAESMLIFSSLHSIINTCLRAHSYNICTVYGNIMKSFLIIA